MKNHSLMRQRGFTIVMVMAIMMIIAIMIVAGAAQTNTELRMSANDADRKLAFSAADEALTWAESRVADKVLEQLKASSTSTFTGDVCVDGVCPLPTTKKVVWADSKIFSCEEKKDAACTDKDDVSRQVILTVDKNSDKAKKGVTTKLHALPRYLGEYLGKGNDGSIHARVTVRAWGVNPNTQVTLQSYIVFSE